ncbi:MAG: response regulator [Candidatus Krumholzibacteriota bacterium]|nr:response regulator [Candidatus Krumholzibacteriota bacterium]
MKAPNRRSAGAKNRGTRTAAQDVSRDMDSAPQGILGLESALYISKKILGRGSIDEALEDILNYLLDLFDLNYSAIILDDITGTRITLSMVASRGNNFNFLKGVTYRHGTSARVDSWLRKVFESEGALELDPRELEDLLLMLAGEKVLSEETTATIIERMEGRKAPHTVILNQRSYQGHPFMLLIASRDKELKDIELELIGGFSETLALAIDRRKQIQQLNQKLSKYKALVDSSEPAFFLLSEGVIEFFSEGLPGILGVPAEKLKGSRLEGYLEDADAEDLRRMITSFLEENGPTAKKYFHVYRLAGSGAEIEIQLNSIEYRKKRVLRGTLENVSRRRALERNVLEGKHLESIATLAGGVAHDYNNLIGAMMGYASLIRNSLPEQDERVAQLRKIEEAGARATKLTRQLLSLSRKGSYRRGIVDIKDVLERATRSCIVPMDHISVSKAYQTEVLNVEGDSAQLYEAFLNICLNAREAMPEGGVIGIHVERQRVDRKHQIFSEGMDTGNYLEIKISDQGKGMNPDTLWRAADPFFTTKRSQKRKGLGLPVARGIVEGHRGKMLIHSKWGEGTEVTIFLPLTDKEQEAESADTARTQARTQRVLVVDDEEIILGLASDMLVRLGYEVETAVSGHEAIEIVRAKQIDLVILDLVMPEINGPETFAQLRKINPELPVIISSGFCEGSVIQDMLRNGAKSFLKKPYRLHDISNVLREAVGTIKH